MAFCAGSRAIKAARYLVMGLMALWAGALEASAIRFQDDDVGETSTSVGFGVHLGVGFYASVLIYYGALEQVRGHERRETAVS